MLIPCGILVRWFTVVFLKLTLYMTELKVQGPLLLIEDDRAIRNSLTELLEMMGFSLLCADNGEAGLSLAKEHNPALILCDIMLPGKTGFEILAQLREKEQISTPFVFLSASAEDRRISEGLSLGANAYLTKPFAVEELLAIINRLLIS